MASSSSSSIFKLNNNNNQLFLKYIEQENGSKVSEQEIEEEDEDGDQEEEVEEKGDDLLKLKLGLGSNGEESSSPNPGGPSRSGSSLGLGLGLGLKLWPNMEEQGEEEGSEMVGLEIGTRRRRFIGRLLPSSSSAEDWYNHTAHQLVLSAHHSHHYHSGLWFTLHSSTNQKGEALPQVPKAYIRVKNEDMTIFTVKKYLVTKLGLFNENEVEVLCMGERLENEERLKMVRNNIWIPSLIHSLNSSSSSQISPNLMPLVYQKHVPNLLLNYF